MEKSFKEAMRFRHACKLFDASRKIPNETLNYILDAGRLSPSSMGLEHWKFLVVQNIILKDKITSLAWGQQQILTSSDLVVILYRKQLRTSDSYTPRKLKDNFNFDVIPEGYRGFIDSKSDKELHSWSTHQTYIAAANMMTAAAMMGIDSCPMEGFDVCGVEKLLGIDTEKYGISLLLPLGYRVLEQPTKVRLPLERVVEYR